MKDNNRLCFPSQHNNDGNAQKDNNYEIIGGKTMLHGKIVN